MAIELHSSLEHDFTKSASEALFVILQLLTVY